MSDNAEKPAAEDMVELADRQLYLEHRKELVALGVAQIGEFDKTLLLLSTGALGVSALFVDTFVGDGETMQMQWALSMAWAAFAFTMLANLCSYLTAYFDTEIERHEWDRKYEQGDLTQTHKNYVRTLTSVLNVLGLVSFVAGLTTLLVFCFNNLGTL